MVLNWRTSDQSRRPQTGQFLLRSTWSARKRLWQFLHSTRGSVKFCEVPEASHTRGEARIPESRPTTSGRAQT